MEEAGDPDRPADEVRDEEWNVQHAGEQEPPGWPTFEARSSVGNAGHD
jgi:hypothetical protein